MFIIIVILSRTDYVANTKKLHRNKYRFNIIAYNCNNASQETHGPEAVKDGVAVVKAEPGDALEIERLPIHPDQLPIPGGQILWRILQR